MIARIGRTLLAFLALASAGSAALAQGNSFNPYGNSGYADYSEFSKPTSANNPALPGQSVLNREPLITRPRANTFQDYTSDLDDVDNSANLRRGGSSNLPYYMAYQRLNSDYDRVYRPNNTDADRKFYERQHERELKFAQAMREVDPVKRAKLLREVERDSLDSPVARGAAKGATTARTAASGSTTPARPLTSAERRAAAPSPFANNRLDPSRSSAARSPARSTPAPSPLSSRPATDASRSQSATDPSTIPVPPPPR